MNCLKPTVSFLIVIVFCSPAWGHGEKTPFYEHPPRTMSGLIFESSFWNINGRQGIFKLTPYFEYAPEDFFSVGLAAPGGLFRGNFLASDMNFAVKGRLNIKKFTIVPILGSELPTGSPEASSRHMELLPGVFLERKIPNWHLYGYAGYRASLPSFYEGTGKDMNAFSPHAHKEGITWLGGSFWPNDNIAIDGRVALFYEDMNVLFPEFQLGGVWQSDFNDKTELKSSLSAFYAPSGLRKGIGGSIALSLSF